MRFFLFRKANVFPSKTSVKIEKPNSVRKANVKIGRVGDKIEKPKSNRKVNVIGKENR
jgi:hypothetical protein